MKPHVICHMGSSLDGRVTEAAFAKGETRRIANVSPARLDDEAASP